MPEVTKTTSEQFTLDWRDFGKGLLVAVGSAVLPIIISAFKAHHFDWWLIGEISVSALSGYLLKNFVQPSQTIIQIKPPANQ